MGAQSLNIVQGLQGVISPLFLRRKTTKILHKSVNNSFLLYIIYTIYILLVIRRIQDQALGLGHHDNNNYTRKL